MPGLTRSSSKARRAVSYGHGRPLAYPVQPLNSLDGGESPDPSSTRGSDPLCADSAFASHIRD
jgi:hypothetical protein